MFGCVKVQNLKGRAWDLGCSLTCCGSGKEAQGGGMHPWALHCSLEGYL